MEMRLEDGNVVITQIIAKKQFKTKLRSCVECSKVDLLVLCCIITLVLFI